MTSTKLRPAWKFSWKNFQRIISRVNNSRESIQPSTGLCKMSGRASRLFSFFFALLNSVNNQRMNTFFWQCLMTTSLRNKEVERIILGKSLRLKFPQLGVDCYCRQLSRDKGQRMSRKKIASQKTLKWYTICWRHSQDNVQAAVNNTTGSWIQSLLWELVWEFVKRNEPYLQLRLLTSQLIKWRQEWG